VNVMAPIDALAKSGSYSEFFSQISKSLIRTIGGKKFLDIILITLFVNVCLLVIFTVKSKKKYLPVQKFFTIAD